MWNPEQYAKFSTERERPFFDLLAQVVHPNPKQIADLGCGTGKLTASLSQRFVGAKIVGVDNSPQMLAKANGYASNHVHFVEDNIATWQPEAALDVIVSNAVLQWLDNHENLLAHFATMLAPGGVLALQMPNNFSAPSHVLLEEQIALLDWQKKLSGIQKRNARLSHGFSWYVQMLLSLGFEVNAWQTTYMHVLHGENAVLEWAKGTALRPVLSVLNVQDQESFLEEYGARLRLAYPSQKHGQGVTSLFPFERMFFVAQKVQP